VNLAAVDLNLLVALDALLSEGSVTRAARRIGRSQPATSHALNRARALFGDPLLVRVGGRLQPTPRARNLAPRLHQLLGALASTLDAGQAFTPASVESVTVAATDYAGFVLLPRVLRLARQQAPRLTVRVRPLEGPDALEPLASGAVDLALGTFPHLPAGLTTERLFDDRFVSLLRRGSRRLTLDEFCRRGHVLVTSPSDALGPVDHALARLGRTRHVAAQVPHFLVAPRIVAETDLVLTTGRRIAEPLARPLGLRLVVPPVALAPFAVRMIWHPRSEEESVARWFRSLVRQAAG
jgi:DNA-binding transcriptional LysR family regulator